MRRVAVQFKYRYRTVVFLLCCCCCLAKMDQQLHRLTDRHYSEVEGLLQVCIIKYTLCARSHFNCYVYNNAQFIFRPSSSAHSRERTHSQNTNTRTRARTYIQHLLPNTHTQHKHAHTYTRASRRRLWTCRAQTTKKLSRNRADLAGTMLPTCTRDVSVATQCRTCPLRRPPHQRF